MAAECVARETNLPTTGLQQQQEAEHSPKLLQHYMKGKIVESQAELSSSQRELASLRQLARHRCRRLHDTQELVSRLRDACRYVGTVQSVLSRRLLKVQLGNEIYVMPAAAGLRPRANSRVCVQQLASGGMLAYQQLPQLRDPLVSLMLVQKDTEATYEMIGGLAEQIRAVREVVELPILHPELFAAVGIEQPKGVLLHGPPGTGKTLLARAVAHHAGCSFFRLSGTELVQKYIGEGARLVRELFLMARERAPAIIFLDEIDSIGAKRSGGGCGSSNCEQTMVELLNQVDGFEPQQNIKIVLATNRIDTLDEALLRPGRVDRKIFFPAPSLRGRVDILRVHSRRMNLARCVDFHAIAELLPGASGAELRLLCQEAAFCALRDGRSCVVQQDFLQRVGKILAELGSEPQLHTGIK